jgi:UDPglucose--hexose-1-phosphate uridylyltransferase
VLAYRDPEAPPNTAGWRVRVVPNKFPALKIEGDLGRRGVGLYDMMNAVGAHEVVIETPDHARTLADLEAHEVRAVLQSYVDRLRELQKDVRFRYILVFKNHGADAGATLEHTHTQIIATPVVPKRVSEEIEGARRHFELRERCVFCDILHQEYEARHRIVVENAEYVAVTPFASRFPYEVWLLPRAHAPRFELTSAADLDGLAEAMRQTLRRLDAALDRPHYNYVLHTSPCNDASADAYYHWHIEIMPKLTKVAGFEWGSGFYINPMPPEEAARVLREVRIP